MSLRTLRKFREIWAIDFEFTAHPGERPLPICLVAWEMTSGRKIRIWEDQLFRMQEPPYSTANDSLIVAFYASAEMGCHIALGWELPNNVLDLFTEFRTLTNQLPLPCGKGLLGALTYFGLNGMDVAEKDSMRKLALRGGPWTLEERQALLDYCESDVRALAELLPRMERLIDVPRALLRGRYMKAAAHIEHSGVPLDTATLQKFQERWEDIQDALIAEIDADYGVFDGRTFKADRFAQWLVRNNIPWPRLPSERLDLKDDTFREMSRIYQEVSPLRELRTSLSQMRLSELAVGKDGRNRCLLSAFQAKTGRNQPSNKKFIFGPSVWLRGLIRPEKEKALAYLDWCQQEFGVAGVLSGDQRMIEAYTSGDPYLTFAKQAGAIPPDATKNSHPQERSLFKECALSVQYGMGEISLAQKIGEPVIQARELLRLHHETYKTFWEWSDQAIDYAMLHGKLFTTFGWVIYIGTNVNPRSLRNFLMQANGAEMLRIACCFAVERGIKVCAPVHDALLIEGPLNEIEETVSKAQLAMSDASAAVLGGFRLRSDAKIIRYPERYMDGRGQKMWDTVWRILNRMEETNTAIPRQMLPGQKCNTTCAPAHSCPI